MGEGPIKEADQVTAVCLMLHQVTLEHQIYEKRRVFCNISFYNSAKVSKALIKKTGWMAVWWRGLACGTIINLICSNYTSQLHHGDGGR